MKTISEFMTGIGCEKWPARWESFYEDVVREFEEKGCPLLEEGYYERLREQYGILNAYPQAYRLGAKEVAKSKGLSVFLALLCRAMKDRDSIMGDIRSMSLPEVPAGCDPVGRNMLPGLAICSAMDDCYEKLKARNLPPDIIQQIMNKPEGGVARYMRGNPGEYGYALFDWYQRAIDGKLHDVGRLEIEINTYFPFSAEVYGDENGSYTVLAQNVTVHRSGYVLGTKGFEEAAGSWHAVITEDERLVSGYPYGPDGLIRSAEVKLDKTRWKKLLSGTDQVINLHIPAKGKLTPRLVDEAIAAAKDYVKKYYPDYDYKAFVCGSWLLDPQLRELLGESSNIVSFGRRFYPLTVKDPGKSVFSFVYGRADLDIAALPETTTLHKALKKHFLQGKEIYNFGGVFFSP